MTEYIERSKVLAEYDRQHEGAAGRARKIIEAFPAADVVEVRHGRWLTTDGFPHRVYCSCCYSSYVPNDNWQIWQDKPGEGGLPRNYCPNCGAKMNGGEDDAAD